MFRKRERKGERARVKGNCSNCPHPPLPPFPYFHSQHQCVAPKWWQQREKKTEKWDHSTQNTCLKGTLIPFVHSTRFVLQTRKLCPMISQAQEPGPSVSTQRSSSLQNKAPDKGWEGFDSPEPNPTSASQTCPRPTSTLLPRSPRASQHCLCPCFLISKF